MAGLLSTTKSNRERIGNVNIRITRSKSNLEQLIRDKTFTSDYINLSDLLGGISNRMKGLLFTDPQKMTLDILYRVSELIGVSPYELANDFELSKENIPPTLLEQMKENYKSS